MRFAHSRQRTAETANKFRPIGGPHLQLSAGIGRARQRVRRRDRAATPPLIDGQVGRDGSDAELVSGPFLPVMSITATFSPSFPETAMTTPMLRGRSVRYELPAGSRSARPCSARHAPPSLDLLYLSARTRETRKPRSCHGPRARCRRGTPTGSTRRVVPATAANHAVRAPRRSRRIVRQATSHNSPRRTSPGTTPTRSRAYHTVPSVGSLPAHRVRHPARVAVEPPVVGKLVSSYSFGIPLRPELKLNRPVLPARHAYSHCASDGSRYRRPAAFSSGISDSFRQNSTASSHDTSPPETASCPDRRPCLCPCPWPRTRWGWCP